MSDKEYKVDLHTHSIISHDGGITVEQYSRLLESGILDFVAITDHNETRFARIMQEKLGEKIIVGEEVTTQDGEIIGLFLADTIPAGLSAQDACAEIHRQGGLVYIPHPFETQRRGLQRNVLDKIINEVDILEVFNGRARFRGKVKEAEDFAASFRLAVASSSDAHCYRGVGCSFSVVKNYPKRTTLKKLLKKAAFKRQHAAWYTLLCPAVNRIKNKLVLGV